MKYLLSPAEVKAHTTVTLNADDHKLTVAMPEAQGRRLRPLLGAALFSALLAFVASAPTPPDTQGQAQQQATAALATYATALDAWRTAHATDPLLNLWDEVKPCLAQWVVLEAWPSILVDIVQAGVVQRTGSSGSGTTQADAATLAKVEGAVRESAVFRGDELVSWLESNRSNYSAYQSTRPLATSRRPSDEFGGINC